MFITCEVLLQMFDMNRFIQFTKLFELIYIIIPILGVWYKRHKYFENLFQGLQLVRAGIWIQIDWF